MSRRSRLRRHKKKSPVPRIIIGTVALTVVFSLLISTTGVAVALGVAGSWLEDLPDINDPNAFNVAQTTRVYSADGVLLANLYLENRQVVELEDISPHLLHAVVAVEDERFYQHNGVDFIGLVRAVITNATTGRREGASTLTQQFIRNTILAEERFEISLKRKAREAYLALELERQHSKDEILALYLNTVYYGEGAYGAEAAALTFFDKHANELTIAEAALLAGLPQAPSRLTPYENPDGAVGRRNWVLSKMFEQGYITSEEYEAGKVEELKIQRSQELD
ncbi:MAG: transglycosylase domain-containing protein, partial [Coriobacteriia bacterium]|nr:transglycosylase domain-containing protein [Coriobacteriia bacterium]